MEVKLKLLALVLCIAAIYCRKNVPIKCKYEGKKLRVGYAKFVENEEDSSCSIVACDAQGMVSHMCLECAFMYSILLGSSICIHAGHPYRGMDVDFPNSVENFN